MYFCRNCQVNYKIYVEMKCKGPTINDLENIFCEIKEKRTVTTSRHKASYQGSVVLEFEKQIGQLNRIES